MSDMAHPVSGKVFNIAPESKYSGQEAQDRTHRVCMQEMPDGGRAAEVLSGVLCQALQQLQHRTSAAEELLQALDQARLHEKERETIHATAIR